MNSSNNSNNSIKYVILFLIFAAAVICSIIFGAQQLNFKDIFSSTDNFSKTIFIKLRLPRMILCCVAGMLLAGSGAAFQMFFRNPLAEPGIMGISAGASLGAVSSACFGSSVLFGGLLSSVNAGAFAGALIAGIIVCTLCAGRYNNNSTAALLLCGTALGSFYSAITSIILSVRQEQLNSMYIWMLGSFNGRGWKEVMFIIVPSVVAFVLLFLCSMRLDLLSGGETTASSLGVKVSALRLLVIVAGSFAVSAAVCAGGTIGFVGLIAPHMMRKIFGAKGRSLIPLSMIGGAILLLVADTLCRIVIAPAEIPVGTITALLGAPFFISLLFNRKGKN